jgi:undecaprenyl-diphosphatase
VTVFATATALAFMAPRLGSWLFVLAVLIAASRVITGAHYPSDVIAGAALGFATVIVMRRAFAARQIVFRSRESGIEARGAGLITTAFVGVIGFGVKK